MRAILMAMFMLFTSMNGAFANDELPALTVQKLTDNVYLHTSFKVVKGFGLVDSNGLVVLVGNDAYLIDTPWSAGDTEKLLDWIKDQGFVIKSSLSTHFHDDRTAGIALLNSRAIPTYASQLTNQLLKKTGKTQTANTFENNDFWLVKNQIEVFYPGAGHSQDNVVVWLPNQKVLLGGCLVRAKETTSIGNTSDAIISAWSESAKRLQTKFSHAKLVIPGHGKVGDLSLLEHTRELVASTIAAKRFTK
jgi:glyoxylase-like metal-dependent hydrolase (beta-lactamase superfamily II)